MNPILILLGVLTIIFCWLWYSISSQTSKGDQRTIVIPSTASPKNKCVSVKTPCDKQDPNSCDNSCDEEGMYCVDLSEYGDKSGGSVCLPLKPNIDCNVQNGGINVWTGYGFTESQGWSCLCQHPEIFGGPHCENQNPSFCSGGNPLDMTKDFSDPNFCTCPANTQKMTRTTGVTPFCASTDPANGGGKYGLAGNLKGTWKDIYINIMPPNDLYQYWSAKIAYSLFGANPTKQDFDNVLQILLATDSSGSLPNLTQNIATQLCNIPGVDLAEGFCSQSVPSAPINFPTGYSPEVSYTYYDNSF